MIDTEQAIKLRVENGLSYSEIAAIQGVSKQAVHQKLQGLLPTDFTPIFKQHKADILARLQERILVSIDDAEIQKAPFGTKVLAVAQLIDKERLERGQATTIADGQIRVLLDAVMPGYQGNSGPVMDAEVINPLIQANAPLPEGAIPPEDSPDVP
jgi:transcriptional regulator with XRE-family HTH domain